jgi:hypothetical protein
LNDFTANVPYKTFGEGETWLTGIADAGSGVYAVGVVGGRYQDLLIDSNVEQGLIPGPASMIERVQSIDNLQNGFLLNFGGASRLVDCIATGCAGGFAAPGGEVAYTRCTARSNHMNGIELNAGCRATDCVTALNVGAGFVVTDQRSSLDGCTAEGNQAGGFYIGGTGNTLNRCAARVNGYGPSPASGFRTGPGVATAHFVDCTSISNATLDGLGSDQTPISGVRCPESRSSKSRAVRPVTSFPLPSRTMAARATRSTPVLNGGAAGCSCAATATIPTSDTMTSPTVLATLRTPFSSLHNKSHASANQP